MTFVHLVYVPCFGFTGESVIFYLPLIHKRGFTNYKWWVLGLGKLNEVGCAYIFTECRFLILSPLIKFSIDDIHCLIYRPMGHFSYLLLLHKEAGNGVHLTKVS